MTIECELEITPRIESNPEWRNLTFRIDPALSMAGVGVHVYEFQAERAIVRSDYEVLQRRVADYLSTWLCEKGLYEKLDFFITVEWVQTQSANRIAVRKGVWGANARMAEVAIGERFPEIVQPSGENTYHSAAARLSERTLGDVFFTSASQGHTSLIWCTKKSRPPVRSDVMKRVAERLGPSNARGGIDWPGLVGDAARWTDFGFIRWYGHVDDRAAYLQWFGSSVFFTALGLTDGTD